MTEPRRPRDALRMATPTKCLVRGHLGQRLPQPDEGRVRGPIYRPRRPSETPLYRVVQQHL